MIRTIALSLVLFAGWISAAFADGGVDALRDAIGARLLLMGDVARYKWNAHLPISDAKREAELIERATSAAVALGLCADYARDVLTAQLEASRTLQTTLFQRWRAAHEGSFAGVPDLASVQRPAIDVATTALLEALVHASRELDRPAAGTMLETPPEALVDESQAWSIATSVLWKSSATSRTCQ